MKRFLKKLLPTLWIALVLSVLAGCCSTLRETGNTNTTRYISNEANVEHLMHATVSVLDPKEASPVCTGFFISPDLIMSARHCFDQDAKTDEDLEAAKAWLTTQDLSIVKYDAYKSPGRTVVSNEVEVVYFPLGMMKPHNENDMVILKLKDTEPKSVHWLHLATKNPPKGARVYTVSLPRGQPWILHQGVVSQYYYDWEEFPRVTMLAVAMQLDGGSSGAALVNDAGQVVGLSHRLDKIKHNAVYLPVETLNKMLKPLEL